MNKEYRLTQDGINELKAELAKLNQRRKKVAERLKIAREFGDLSENAEYHAAREEQVQVEARVAEIENVLKNVHIIDTSKKHLSKVQLGAKVRVTNGEGKEQQLYLVGSVEANPLENKISDESPLGQALLNKRIGDQVTVNIHNGTTTTYIINSID